MSDVGNAAAQENANYSHSLMGAGQMGAIGATDLQYITAQRMAAQAASDARFLRQTALDFAMRAGEPLPETMARANSYLAFLHSKETTNGE